MTTSRDWRGAMVRYYWGALTPEQREEAQWQPAEANDDDHYATEFQRLHHEEMTTWTSDGVAASAGRYAFWGMLEIGRAHV